jgi:cbb3-type cytochrome oxidase subunit 3
MRNIRRLIWTLVILLVFLIIIAMILLPTRPVRLENARRIGHYLTDCATSHGNKRC